MLQRTKEIENFRATLAERARVQLLALRTPEITKKVNKTLLYDLLPYGWSESVYEYPDKYFVHLDTTIPVSKSDELFLMGLIRKELGTENIITIMAENSQSGSSIKVQLKKKNYEKEVCV